MGLFQRHAADPDRYNAPAPNRACGRQSASVIQKINVPKNATDATPITTVVVQPRTRSAPRTGNRPMIFGLFVMSISSTIIGTAIRPLITALQNRAEIGSMGEKFTSAP